MRGFGVEGLSRRIVSRGGGGWYRDVSSGVGVGGGLEGRREQKRHDEDIECGSRRCEENGVENSRRGGDFRHGREFRTGRTKRGDWRGGE